ncbi:MAG: DUF1295 domain-containing protein [Planctomycetota bacterium]|nr:DUF1295 domain-containing protein [Planctomycetota bacterium]MDW8372791.1 DUF1295 domain-containing protein [Planctomycetota bacterium]
MIVEVLSVWGVASVAMAAAWVWQLRSRDAGIVDVLWAYGVGGAGLWLLAAGDGDPGRRAVLAVLLALWSLRLGTHLLLDRVLRSRGEDGRYADWRASSGARWPLVSGAFFLAQALFVALFAIPAACGAQDPRPWGEPLDWLGLVLWGAGWSIEALADRQLAAWRRDPAHAGRTCRAGLWRYSRHPNYFGEWLQWLAWPLLALGGPAGLWLLLHPLLVLAFLWWFTGIPHCERRALRSRGDDYRRYQQTTSPFFPWPPRSEEAS